MMALFGFVVTVNRWQVRKKYRELEQARNPWAGPAVTEDRVASPRNGPGKDPAERDRSRDAVRRAVLGDVPTATEEKVVPAPCPMRQSTKGNDGHSRAALCES